MGAEGDPEKNNVSATEELVANGRKTCSADDIVEFECVLRKIGQWGRTQKLQLILLACIVIPCAFHNMGMVFLGFVPKHRCHVPGMRENLTHEDRVLLYNSSIPREIENGVYVFSKCNIYVRGNISNDQNVIGSCGDEVGRWDYDREVMRSSVTTEWNLVCDSKWLVAFAQTIYFLGFFCGCAAVGDLSDRFGRRLAVVACSGLQAVFGIATYFSPSYPVFIVLRFILGFATGGQRNSAYVLAQEWCTEDMRIVANVMCESMWSVGCLILGGLAYACQDWRTLELVCSATAVVCVLYRWIFMPSPRWLLTKGRSDEALEVLKKAAKWNGRPLPDDFDLSKISFEKEVSTSLLDPLRTHNLRLTTMIVWLNWFVVGMIYFGLSYNIGNLTGNFYINHTIISLMGSIAMVPLYLVLRTGRRWPIALSMIGSGLACLAVMLLPKGEMTITTTVFACMGKFCADLVFGVVYVYTSEVYPTCIRTIGMGTGSMCARLGAMLSPFVVLLSDINHVIPYIIFGAFALGTGLLSMYLPETHKRPLVDTVEEAEKINRLFCRCREPVINTEVVLVASDDPDDEKKVHLMSEDSEADV